jgi:hypothetical protein
VSGVNRIGSAADKVTAHVAQDDRTYNLALEAKELAKSDLDTATRERDIECAGKRQNGLQCQARRGVFDTAQARYDAAVVALRTAPTPTGSGLAQRLAALLPITERDVNTYLPYGWPIAAFFVGTVFLSIGLHTPKAPVIRAVTKNPNVTKTGHGEIGTRPPIAETIGRPQSPKPLLSAPKHTPLKLVRPAAGNVAAYLKARTRPSANDAVTLAELRADYLVWCKDEELDAVAGSLFVSTIRRALEQNGLRAVIEGSNVKCVGLKLAESVPQIGDSPTTRNVL